MSTSIGIREQPFECHVCHNRFTRHENLKRHAALHDRTRGIAAYTCRLCATTFSRRDLLDRHTKRKHSAEEQHERPAKVARRDTVTSLETTPTRDTSGPRTPRQICATATAVCEADNTQNWGDYLFTNVGNDAWEVHGEIELDQLGKDYLDTLAIPSFDANCQHSGEQASTIDLEPYSSHTESMFFGPGNTDLHLNDTSGIPSFCGTSNRRSGISGRHSFPIASSRTLPNCIRVASDSPESHFAADPSSSLDEWYPSSSQISRGVDLFFAHISPFVPFLHQPTFDPSMTPRFLVLSMLSLAYQYGEDPENSAHFTSGHELSLHCFSQARMMAASQEESDDDITHNLTLVQSLLLLELYAMMYVSGKDSKYGLKMHSRMISIARSAGLMQSSSTTTVATKDLDSMWRESLKAETHKRTILAAHQIDALWYQLLSVPRSLSHLEIKHDLPSERDCWEASSAAAWAHRRLVSASNSSSMQYTIAVRKFLSRTLDLEEIPPFDPYGAINIAQFLLSSAREVSGWSAITGQLSLERFGPLHESLVSLLPFICPANESDEPSRTATGMATWHMAMIELNIWSPSHTCGIVDSSIEAILNHSTHLASSSKLAIEASVAASIQPHLDWFLEYLSNSGTVDSEAPWVTLYAYKAFLLAWQLIRTGVPRAMQVVGVEPGDSNGALVWGKSAFMFRNRWQLGKQILDCLQILA